MKYCQGKCRVKYIRTEKSAIACPYHRSYSANDNKGGNKIFEVCVKKGLIDSINILFWKTFFPDLMELNSLSNGSRRSKRIIENRENYISDRDLI